MCKQCFGNVKPFCCISICLEPHLQTTPNPAGSPHSISQIPTADRHRRLMTDMEKREKMQARIRKLFHRTKI